MLSWLTSRKVVHNQANANGLINAFAREAEGYLNIFSPVRWTSYNDTVA